MYNERQVEELLRNYNLLEYNKKNYGKYINNIFSNKVDFDISEDDINVFMNTFEKMWQYPVKGMFYYSVLKNLYVEDKSAIDTANEMKKNRSTIYHYKEKGIIILCELFKEELAYAKIKTAL